MFHFAWKLRWLANFSVKNTLLKKVESAAWSTGNDSVNNWDWFDPSSWGHESDIVFETLMLLDMLDVVSLKLINATKCNQLKCFSQMNSSF